jgi:hypothetical protein
LKEETGGSEEFVGWFSNLISHHHRLYLPPNTFSNKIILTMELKVK